MRNFGRLDRPKFIYTEEIMDTRIACTSEECNNERKGRGDGREEGTTTTAAVAAAAAAAAAAGERFSRRDLSSRVATAFNPRIHDVSRISAVLAT